MIISRTPFRISFFGGGTDYPAWYMQHGGAVLSATIDKYCYLTCRYLPPFFEHRIRLVYSKIENCQTVDEIKHPSAREILRFLEIERGVEIHHDGDLPARSGMGSSSSFTVGLLNALYALQGRMPGKHQLASEALHIEQTRLRETVGSQDQVATAYGGFNHISFLQNGEFSVRPMTLPPARIKDLNDHLMLFYTGIKRTASDVAESYVPSLDEKRRQLRIMKDLVDEAIAILTSGQSLNAFGDLLNEGWQVKRSLGARITNSLVEDMYGAARANGALGGKLLGAGGGGFLLLFVEPEKQQQVKEALHQLIHVPFQFEYGGSQIIFCDQEPDYAAADRARIIQPARRFVELEARESV